MKWKNRLTNYNFWISMVSAVLLLFQAFDFEFDILYVNEILTAVLGMLVLVGIISDPTKTYVEPKTKVEKEVVKIEESKQEEQVDKEKVEDNIPNIQESEIDTSVVQNDLQAIINKIASDLANLRNDIMPVSSSLNGVEMNVSVPELVEEVIEQVECGHNIVND